MSSIVHPARPRRRSSAVFAFVAAGLGPAVLAGCAATPITDPVAELLDPGASPSRQVEAVGLIGADAAPGPAELEALAGAVSRPVESPEVRLAAVRRLAEFDRDAARRVLRRTIPNMNAWRGLDALCGFIAERGMVELAPALVSSWSRRIPGFDGTEFERPEAIALAALHGEDAVMDSIYDVLLGGDSISNAALRARTWELLHRLGERSRLAELVERHSASENDLMMQDLAAGIRDLGILPRNREEILWLRTLRDPAFSGTWSEAREAIAAVPESRRLALELRDLPIVIAARRHRPDLLAASAADLEAGLAERLRGARLVSREDRSGPSVGRDRLGAWRGRLTWSDLAAMHLVLQAMEVPQVRDHLFDFADRDREDRGTEYGGVLSLDRQGRFELLEFEPRVRTNDRRFVATQAMLDRAYTSLFHFHLHAQDHDNRAWAGPGAGDLDYADALRANCLVFSFINRDEMNLDYYRHGRVSVDLGSVRRP